MNSFFRRVTGKKERAETEDGHKEFLRRSFRKLGTANLDSIRTNGILFCSAASDDGLL